MLLIDWLIDWFMSRAVLVGMGLRKQLYKDNSRSVAVLVAFLSPFLEKA